MDNPETTISEYLQTAYDDQHLAALLAHAEDGKLSYFSCCCVAGGADADHALKGENEYVAHPSAEIPYPIEFWTVSNAYQRLSHFDAGRRAKLIPLIRAEMVRRESLATHNVTAREYGDSVRELEQAGVFNKMILILKRQNSIAQSG